MAQGYADIPLRELRAFHDELVQREEKSRHHAAGLMAFTTHTKPDYIPTWFHKTLALELDQFLEDVVERRSPRLLIQAPPRHGKSELVSRRLPAYALGKYPGMEIINTSYSADLAERMNADVQRIIDSPEAREAFPNMAIPAKGRPNRSGKKRKADFVELLNGPGSLRSAGVDGGITGMGMHLGLIDDPFKDEREAGSKARRDAVWKWYLSTFYTRLAPGAGILIVLTRWHEDDLAGRLIKAMFEDPEADQWRVLNFPAISEEPAEGAEDERHPDDKKNRDIGEALCSERYDLKALLRFKKILGSYFWNALYMGRPTSATGDIFKTHWWRYWRALPTINLIKIYADTAMKKGEANDWSVFQVWALSKGGEIFLLDQIREKWESPELKAAAIEFWNKWRGQPMGDDVPPPIALCIEDKASGTGLIQSVQRESAIPVLGIQRGSDDNKVVRARSSAPSIEAGRVYLPDPTIQPTPFLSDYKAEFSSFSATMAHAHDDQVDPTMDAIHDLILGNASFYEGAL